MKKILGLDVGTNSIGWAFVHEKEKNNESSAIVRLGVRVVPLTTDESKNFTEGKSITTNASRTLKRHARRNKDRYKLRRKKLREIFIKEGWISKNTSLDENYDKSTHDTYRLRSIAVSEKIKLEEFARVLLMINKKRGYKSSRKAKNEDESGSIISEIDIALQLQKLRKSPSEYARDLLENKKKVIPAFYRSDLISEFEAIWAKHQARFPDILTNEFKTQILGKAKTITTKTFYAKYGIDTIKLTSKNKKLERYAHRVDALKNQEVDINIVSFALAEINGDISSSSGYLGAIGDRSKILHFDNITVGQYLFKQINQYPDKNLKNNIFYRQDYIDEFEKIWETQAGFYPQLTDELKIEIRDRIIFYQRRLKSQKGLINFCELESRMKKIKYNGKEIEKRIGSRVAPRSSPLFQEFKIWSILANVEVKNIESGETLKLDLQARKDLFELLSIRHKLSGNDVLKILFGKESENWKINYKNLEGNTTNAAFLNAYEQMLFIEGNEMNFGKMTPTDILETLSAFFESLGIDSRILKFDTSLKGHELVRQPAYKLWQLLYSYEGDESRSGIDSLIAVLINTFGFNKQQARILASIDFLDDYGKLSAKAIRKLLPYLQENDYSEACQLAGYKHSAYSLSTEENDKRVLIDLLPEIKRNSLRNPVVEKILNQVVNVVNLIIKNPDMGRPDEIRVELARDLKNSKSERERMTRDIAKATKRHEKIREILRLSPFNIKNPSRNDIIRYKLYEELAKNGYKDLYEGKPIKAHDLFSNKYDIEHIIPKALCFDDSFSNKTLCRRDFNAQVKGAQTAYDCIVNNRGDQLQEYLNRVENAYDNGNGISRAKYQKLLKPKSDIGEGFIERDLRNTQYIAKETRLMLMKICRNVNSTTGKITDRLRSDWDLINVMKELNLEKYKAANQTKIIERKTQNIEVIKDWTKRNDHRHHAMDALVVAFTKSEHVQVLNNLHAKSDKSKRYFNMYAKITEVVNRKTLFKSPIDNFRSKAKDHLESILISIKAKNKVATTNINRVKTKTGTIKQVTLTPRGQLHEETIYGSSKYYVTKLESINAKFDLSKINTVAKQKYRTALLKRLEKFDNDSKKAFTGKNSPIKNPILLSNGKEVPAKVKTVTLENRYTIRKPIDGNLKLEKIIDKGIQKTLINYKEKSSKPSDAFTNIKDQPIWINQDISKSVKRVKITGVKNATAIHSDNERGLDFVSLGNNHHVAVYIDDKGKWQENVVSFYEVATRKRLDIPVIDREYKKDEGWSFQFTLKQNEMFIIPKDDVDLSGINLKDPKNKKIISPYLFRVQKITKKDYMFNHHLNTMAITADDQKNRKSLTGITFYRFNSPIKLKDLIKIRINHLGDIVSVGEY